MRITVLALALAPLLGAACGSSSNHGTGGEAGSSTSSDGGAASNGGANAGGSAGSANTGGGGASVGGAGGAAASSSAGSGGMSFDRSHVPSTLGNGTTQGSPGCDLSGATLGAQTVSLTVDGGARTATVFVPTNYDPDKAYPVVFVFHGDGGTGAGIRPQLDLEPDADGKAIFAYPDGANGTWNYKFTGQNTDMDLVLAVRDKLRSQLCVDMKRTFLTGMSRGGFFTNQLACRYGNAEFAAIAPHSSTIEQDDDNAYVFGPPNPNGGPFVEGVNAYDFRCPSDPASGRPALPPAAMVIHGECDTEDGVEYPKGRYVAEHWGYAAHCSTTPAVEVETSPNPSCDKTQFTGNPTLAKDPCYHAPGCTADHEIEFCAIPSMDHRIWADAHSHIWSFFAAH